ncbi:hypothetical protein ACKKBF_B35815 [Auxenochlorella protothecoides x Auxenochlorella symbiontica]|uniref:Enhancer of rudimentary homolog n=1 Tax=Auxenochlorella protothecoides TaxID=3075 RepID=A0A1D2AGL3_AUXPR
MSLEDKRHTIVLLQTGRDKSSRTFSDFDSTADALTGICSMYEKLLRELNPHLAEMTYELDDLFAYLDRLPEVSMLIYDPSLDAYTPHTRAWVKKAALAQLQGLAAPMR